ncbi:MAG: protein kinase, partial [Gemmatimonadetes bacterium]|nr:protein kinase [Gemmatimonadota bacterium]
PVDDAVQIAKNLAEALDYAHRQGVIHRDIKPANVLLQDGKPVIADFGIALAVGAGAMSRMTETGLSLGTPHYMSPEQATGDQNVGPATDTYALGCVLYEMLAGEPPYTGTTPQAILAKIISETPASVTKERRSVPPNVDASIRKACEKLPGDRFTSAHEFAEALSNPGFRYGTETFSTGEARRWRSLGLVGWAATAVLAAVLGWNMLQPEERPVQRSVMGFIPGEQPVSGLNNFAVSPDGTLFGYVGGTPRQIWIKEAENLNARAIPGTEGAWALAFSPDGSQIAFQRGADLLKVSAISGEPPVQLDTGPLSRDLPGLTWLDDDRIVYASSNFELWSVPATGGAPEQLSDRRVQPIGMRALAFPTALPDARGVLFAACTAECRNISLGVLDLRTGEKRELVENSAVGLYAEGGYLVYGRTDGALYGVQFDLEGLEITGEPRLLVEGLSVELGRAGIALSDRGDLVYREPNFDDSGERTLQWVGLDGSEEAVDRDWRAGFHHVSVSPDGESVAVSIQSEERLDIWTRRLDGSPPVRLTFEGRNHRPTWSADGAFVH